MIRFVNKKELRSRIFWGVGAFCFLTFFVVKTFRNKEILKEKQDYTVGVAIETYKGAKDPIPSIKYSYSVGGVQYEKGHGFDPKIYHVEIGRKYLIIFSPTDPSNSRMLLKVMLPDSTTAPFNGWRYAPFAIKDSTDVEW